jgi:acetylornithine deacetylase/succinyl-diaminopimelate desuccinylase-like protein
MCSAWPRARVAVRHTCQDRGAIATLLRWCQACLCLTATTPCARRSATVRTCVCRIGLETTVLCGPKADGGQPILIAKWCARDAAAAGNPALLLNAHYDVVPVIDVHWTRPAFAAHTEVVDGEERIYGRGAQDMKLVPVQYLVAISRLLFTGAKPNRDVYLSFVPDEEVTTPSLFTHPKHAHAHAHTHTHAIAHSCVL